MKDNKRIVTISINEYLDDYMNDLFKNKSKYIEWLIHQDLTKSGLDTKNIIL